MKNIELSNRIAFKYIHRITFVSNYIHSVNGQRITCLEIGVKIQRRDGLARVAESTLNRTWLAPKIFVFTRRRLTFHAIVGRSFEGKLGWLFDEQRIALIRRPLAYINRCIKFHAAPINVHYEITTVIFWHLDANQFDGSIRREIREFVNIVCSNKTTDRADFNISRESSRVRFLKGKILERNSECQVEQMKVGGCC